MDKFVDVIFETFACKGIVIADGAGVVTQIEDNCGSMYALKALDLVGHSVYELEKKGVFKPSCVARVLEAKKEVTIIQTVPNKQSLVVTGFPILDDAGDIIKVITFARDISAYNKLEELYDEFVMRITFYNETIEELYYGNMTQDLFFTNNPQFHKDLEMLGRVAKYNVTILMSGETGTGKTLLAKKIHGHSNHSKGQFIEINCGSMPEELIESELFGYEEGAFVGGDKEGKKGLIEAAHEGTLFLDEISELSAKAQEKLLHVLQDKKVRRGSSAESQAIDCRFIVATNKDLAKEVQAGRFREDLLCHLNMVPVSVPALRERLNDIMCLSKSILKKYNDKYEKNAVFHEDCIAAFMDYPWPGNVRELENVIQRLVIMTVGTVITKEYFPEKMQQNLAHKPCNLLREITDLESALETYESTIINEFVKVHGSSIKVAKALNISQTTAARKIRKYVPRHSQA